MKTTKKTTSNYIQSYLNRRSTPASRATIVTNVSSKTSVKSDTILRTISRMVNRGTLVSVPLTGKNTTARSRGYQLSSN